MFPEFHENFTVDFHELLDLPENPACNVPFYDRAIMKGYGSGFTCWVQGIGRIDSHLDPGSMASPAFRGYPDRVVDAGGALTKRRHVFEEFLLCKLVGKRMNICKPREDGAKIGKLDNVTRIKLLTEQDGIFEDFLGRGSDRYAHSYMIAELRGPRDHTLSPVAGPL